MKVGVCNCCPKEWMNPALIIGTTVTLCLLRIGTNLITAYEPLSLFGSNEVNLVAIWINAKASENMKT